MLYFYPQERIRFTRRRVAQAGGGGTPPPTPRNWQIEFNNPGGAGTTKNPLNNTIPDVALQMVDYYTQQGTFVALWIQTGTPPTFKKVNVPALRNKTKGGSGTSP